MPREFSEQRDDMAIEVFKDLFTNKTVDQVEEIIAACLFFNIFTGIPREDIDLSDTSGLTQNHLELAQLISFIKNHFDGVVDANEISHKVQEFIQIFEEI